jgi:hypothetical protein
VAGLREIVEAEALEPASYGLLSLRDPKVADGIRWYDGFTYESRACNHTVRLLDICGGLDPVDAIVPDDPAPPEWRDYKPFGIEAYDKCTTFGYEKRDVEQRAIDALELCTQKAVEAEFWTGELATTNSYDDNRYLASTAAVDVTPSGGPVKVRYGLALLEQALASCGCGARGVIHATTEVGSVLPVKQKGDHLETQLGNYIVVGSGYPGTGPDGTAPGTGVWMYGTGMVTVRLGTSEAVGTRNQQIRASDNTWEARAQRVAAVVWDGCCVYGVHVDLALDYA